MNSLDWARGSIFLDSTVQEKAIAFPTDARLYHKMRVALVRGAEKKGFVYVRTISVWVKRPF